MEAATSNFSVESPVTEKFNSQQQSVCRGWRRIDMWDGMGTKARCVTAELETVNKTHVS